MRSLTRQEEKGPKIEFFTKKSFTRTVIVYAQE